MNQNVKEFTDLLDEVVREKNKNQNFEIQLSKADELKQLLSDLSGAAVSKTAVEDATLMTPPPEMTELEKAIVCIALYWLGRDVEEKECSPNNYSN